MGRGTPFLLYQADDGAQLMLDLEPGLERVTIGRRASCELALPWDDEVSRLHAELVRMGAEWVVHDDGLSHNGTFVNGDRIHGRRRLRTGDILQVGGTLISLCAPEHGSTAAPTRAACPQTWPWR